MVNLSAETGLESPQTVHGMGGIVSRGYSEKIVFPGAVAPGVPDGRPLEKLIWHKFPLQRT